MDFAPGTSFFPWHPTAWLRVAGGDALIYLQGQFTNDLRELGPDGAYGLWLNGKGKVVADSFVLPAPPVDGAPTFWVGSYFSPAAAVRARLESCIVADEVEVEDVTADWAAVTIFGAVDRAALRSAVPGSLVFPGRRDVAVHHEWVFPAAAQAGVQARLAGLPPLSEADLRLRRVRAGIAAVPADLGEGELPNEGGLENVAISHTKGCYLGQEVMARLKTMGQVRRRLLRVTGSEPVPTLPTAVYAGDRAVGELRSAVAVGDGFEGLALLTLLHLPADGRLSLAPGARPTLQCRDRP
jgi:tRNA-modifying protein YgfZ